MPRHLFKRFMLDERKIKNHPFLSKLGLGDPNLWHCNRRSVSVAFLVGVFCAFIPMPLQMIAAAVLAILIRCNLPLSVGLVWITNPLTIPPIFYFSYLVGASLLGTEVQHESTQFSVEWLADSISQIWAPLLAGSFVCGTVFGILSCLVVRYLWIIQVTKSWKERKVKRQKRAAKLLANKKNIN